MSEMSFVIIKLLPSIITALIAAFAAIFAVYLTNKYTKDRENEELEHKRREANSLVIDILAAWIHGTFDQDASEDKKIQYRYEMQTTYWKSMLWIDKGLLTELNKRLTGKECALTTNQLIALTRKYVQGLEESDIAGEDIVTWSAKEEGSKIEPKK